MQEAILLANRRPRGFLRTQARRLKRGCGWLGVAEEIARILQQELS